MDIKSLLLASLLIVSAVAALLRKKQRQPPFIPSLLAKHVFITGGSTGIGYAIARRALFEGAYVTITGRSVENLEKARMELMEEVKDCNERLRSEVVDAGDYNQMKQVIGEAFGWKPIDVLVCNAGLTRSGYLDELPIKDIDLTVQTNLLGTLYTMHAALPLMKLRSPDHPMSVVLMGSLSSLFVMYGNSAYTATKYALKGLAESLILELLPYSIRVSLICPGFVQTAFLDEAEKIDELQPLMRNLNWYDRKQAQTPDSVAKHTLRAVKHGLSIVTTTPVLGQTLLLLGRGFMPDDSIVRTAMETMLFPLARWVTVIAKISMHGVIRTYHRRNPSPEVVPKGVQHSLETPPYQ